MNCPEVYRNFQALQWESGGDIYAWEKKIARLPPRAQQIKPKVSGG